MIDKTPIPGLDLNSTEAKIQMNNFWNYLDDLAEKNPEEYKKFIQTQMKKGIETFGPSKQEKQNKEFKVTPYLCLRFKPTKVLKQIHSDPNDIQIHDNAIKNEMKEIPQIQFGNEFASDAFSSKVLQDRKIYLNILTSEEYFAPTDDQGNFLSGDKLKDENNWRYIPTEFRYNGKNDSMSGTRCDYYDVIINSFVIEKVKKDKALYKTILGYVVRKFVIFLSDKYELYTNSVKIVQEKKYKSLTSRPDIFKSTLGEKNKLTTPPQPQAKPKVEEVQREIKITPTEIQNASNPPLEGKEEKKVVIEEVGAVNKQIIPLKKKILNNHQMEVQFMFDEFEHLKGISEIDLQISENGIIIHLDSPHYIIDKNYEPVEMKFNFKVDPDKCTAKYNKKEKLLTVVIERII